MANQNVKKVGSVVIDDEMLQRATAANAEGANYTGAGDNTLDFGKAKSFIAEEQTGKRANLTIDNTTGSDDVNLQLNEILAAIEDTHVIKDGEVVTGCKISCTPCKASVLAKYLQRFQTRLRAVKFAASDSSQLDEPLRSYRIDPFTKNPVEDEKIPSNYQSQDTNNPNMVDVDDLSGFQTSELQTITYKVQAGKKVTLSLFFGATLDIAGALSKKAEDAATIFMTSMECMNAISPRTKIITLCIRKIS